MKKKLRKEFLALRNNLTLSYREDSTKKILNTLERLEIFKNANRIFVYISFGSEIATENFIKKYINEKEIFVPKIINEKMALVKLKDWNELKVGHFNVLEPTTNEYYNGEIDLVITPSIVFDKNGYRLGYGKGYYDKYFTEKNYKTSIGLSFDKLLQNNLPIEKHDQSVDFIITEKGIIKTNEKNNSHN